MISYDLFFLTQIFIAAIVLKHRESLWWKEEVFDQLFENKESKRAGNVEHTVLIDLL